MESHAMTTNTQPYNKTQVKSTRKCVNISNRRPLRGETGNVLPHLVLMLSHGLLKSQPLLEYLQEWHFLPMRSLNRSVEIPHSLLLVE